VFSFVLAACTSDVKQWYMQNGLQLNPDKSEALIIGTANQLCTVTPAISSVSVAGVNLPVADEMKALGVVLDRRLTFQKDVMAVARSCNYHSQAIHYLCHLLSRELVLTLACILILTIMDYCNSVLYGTPSSSIQTGRYCSECRTMQPGSSSRLHDVLMPGHYCGTCTGCPFNTELSTRSLC